MNAKGMSKTEQAWATLFDKHDILREISEKGLFEITAGEIKKLREPRLMANFHHRASLPRLFVEHGLNILPLTRGSYVIGAFDAYQSIEHAEGTSVVVKRLPEGIRSVDPNNLYSESIALNCAFLAGIIDDILGDRAAHTLSGRMTTGSFEFSIRSRRGDRTGITVRNAQCEIDGGYESQSKLLLVEAKNVSARDFLVRQLYYPYRLWEERIKKKIIPAFMIFSNDIFSFFIYEFEERASYNSLRLVTQKKYAVAAAHISTEDIAQLVEQVQVIKEPKVPFPQADSFERVVDLLNLLVGGDMSGDEITSNYDFDRRQTDYYTNAGVYLGLIQKRRIGGESVYSISSRGRAIMLSDRTKKLKGLVATILGHEVFKRASRARLDRGKPVGLSQIEDIMKSCEIYNVRSSETYRRRAQTVAKWVEWIVNLPNEWGP